MFNNPNIFNPAITYNNRVYFNTPSGGKYEHKVYNPNNQSTRLPYNMGQEYNKGTPKYYENLKGVNSSVFKHDDIAGKTVYTESGRPIVIRNNPTTKIPQVKYDYDIPVKRDWIQTEYCDVDEKHVRKTVGEHLKNHFNLPLDSDVKPSYRATNPTQLPVITDKTIDYSYNKDYDLKSRDMTNENIMDLIKNRNSQYSNTKKNVINSTTQNPETFKTSDGNSSKTSINQREYFSEPTLPDTDDLYKQMIRSYAKAVSFYLNNNDKYKHWKQNWEILEKNLIKSDLTIDRLQDHDDEIAYTENKGDIIKFRWRDKENYISKNVFMYVVLHELTHQVFPMTFRGHKDPFPDMLCIMCVAGLELDLFDLSSIPINTVYTNNQPICSRNSVCNELMRGIEILRDKNKGSDVYYDHLTEYIKSKMSN